MVTETARPRICVFCSTKTGQDDKGPAAAKRLAQVMHEHDIELIYGGGSTGLMGELSRERTKLGGIDSVLGVIPYALVDRERDVRSKGTAPKEKISSMLSALGIKTTPQSMDKERPGDEIYDLPADPVYGRVVGAPSLARRKGLMIDLVKRGGKGSGFVALPGAFGSLDEVLEVITHRQLGVHNKAMVLVNVDGFWDGIRIWMENASQKGFLMHDSRDFVKIVDTPEEAVNFLLQVAQ